MTSAILLCTVLVRHLMVIVCSTYSVSVLCPQVSVASYPAVVNRGAVTAFRHQKLIPAELVVLCHTGYAAISLFFRHCNTIEHVHVLSQVPVLDNTYYHT